jgi:hypothetical protein
MWNDPIVEEVRKIRDEHAKKFNYDLRAIAEDLKKQQAANGRKVVTLAPKKPVVLPKAKVDSEK